MESYEIRTEVCGAPAQEEKKAINILLAQLIRRPEDRVEASFLLDADDFEDEDRVQLRVYKAIMEKSAIYNEEFGANLVQMLLGRSDFAAANLVQEQLPAISCPDSRRGFFRLLLLVHDLALPRRAYEAEMRLLDELRADGWTTDEVLSTEDW